LNDPKNLADMIHHEEFQGEIDSDLENTNEKEADAFMGEPPVITSRKKIKSIIPKKMNYL
jgi:hypothetical protein